MATTFEQALAEHVRGDNSAGARRARKVLAMPDSPRRQRIMARWEDHASVHVRNTFGMSKGARIDWGSIDWAAVLDFILKMLPLILALFGA